MFMFDYYVFSVYVQTNTFFVYFWLEISSPNEEKMVERNLDIKCNTLKCWDALRSSKSSAAICVCIKAEMHST